MNRQVYDKASSEIKNGVKKLYQNAEAMRSDGTNPLDVSLSDVIQESPLSGSKGEIKTQAALLAELGIDTSVDTISNIFTLPDDAPRWIVPEIIRDYVRLGLRKSPIYPNIIAATQALSSPTANMPWLNMSDAAPRWVNEGETITFGAMSYGNKSFSLRKMGRGIKISDEVKRYVSLDVVGIFLQDFGVKLGYALDSLAVDVLLNGEQANGSASAPVIGVNTVGTVAYRDFLKIWVRLSRLGRAANTLIAGESMAIDILDLPEFKNRQQGTTEANLTVRTPIPKDASMYIHGSIPDDQVVILDPSNALIKYDSAPLMVESERIVSNQTEATYATVTTGFGTMFRDSRLILDSSVSFTDSPFPPYMNVDAMEVETIK